MSEALEVPLRDLKKWLEQETVSVIEPLRDKGMGLLNDVESRLNDLRETCEKLLEDGERERLRGDPKTYRRARAMCRFARYVFENVDKVTIPDKISHEILHMLCEDLEKALATIGRERARLFSWISPYFIIDRRRFDAASKKVVESLEELRTFSSHHYVKAKAVEDAFSMIDKLLPLLNKLDEVERRRKRIELRRKVLEGKMAENQRKIMFIQSRDEVRELVQINKKIEELEGKVKHDLRYLQKPFFKFQSLARGPDVYLPFDEAKKLDKYLNDPFKALATEKKGHPLLKRILRRMNAAMVRGKLKLKSSRLRKAQEQINNILEKDALTSLHLRCKEAFSQRQRLLTSEAMAAFQKELAQLQKDQRDLRKREEFVNSRGAVLDNEYKKVREKIESQKKELESIVWELTDKSVQVLL